MRAVRTSTISEQDCAKALQVRILQCAHNALMRIAACKEQRPNPVPLAILDAVDHSCAHTQVSILMDTDVGTRRSLGTPSSSLRAAEYSTNPL